MFGHDGGQIAVDGVEPIGQGEPPAGAQGARKQGAAPPRLRLDEAIARDLAAWIDPQNPCHIVT